MKHFTGLAGLSRETAEALLDRAAILPPGAPVSPALKGRTLALAFFEPSTRTRVSFELAARRLGAHVINVDANTSSSRKGESAFDTCSILAAMGVDGLVVRSDEPGLADQLAARLGQHVAILNAGEGRTGHPTQGLLDLLTIREHKGNPAELSVAIVGDIAHSRVARCAARGLALLGCRDLRLIAPQAWQPTSQEFPEAFITDDIALGLQGCDVVMALRIQRERLEDAERLDEQQFIERYQINEKRLSQASPEAIVMHPGPMNRGVEISDEVASGRQSVILRQVANGVAVRTAVFEAIAEGRGWWSP